MKTIQKLSIRIWLSITSLCIVIVLGAGEAVAQDLTDNKTKAWVKLGLGHSGGDQFSGFTGMVSAYYATRFGIMGIRYLDSHDGSNYPAIFPSADRINGIRELNLNLGYQVDVAMLNLSTSAGIGHVWGSEKTSNGERFFSGMSLPIEAQVLFKPVSFLGIGVAMSVSIMSKTTISSGLIVVQIGRL